MKIEYRLSEVIIYGWIASGFSARELELAGFANRQIVSKAMKVIEKIKEILTTANRSQRTMQNSSSTIDAFVNEALNYDRAKQYDKAFESYLKAAELGSALAQNNVGYAYLFGEGTIKNYAKAIYWLEKSAAQNFAGGYNNLGLCYSKGLGVAQDKDKALDLYQKATNLGSKKALENIEKIKIELENSRQTSISPTSVDQQTVDDLWRQGLQYYQSDRFDLALDQFIKAAELGSAPAQYQTGYMYTMGKGTAQDHTKALYWLEKSAAQNFASAYNGLGLCYFNGFGVPKDLYKALEYYQKAAALGHENAKNSAEELKKNLENIQTVDNQKTIDALWNEGLQHYQSDRFDMAMDNFIKAAQLGSAQAQYQTGYMYMMGKGAAQDYTKAIDWLEKSAAQDFASAYNALGLIYKNGYGVEQNPYKALEYYVKAATLGHECAKNTAVELKEYLKQHNLL